MVQETYYVVVNEAGEYLHFYKTLQPMYHAYFSPRCIVEAKLSAYHFSAEYSGTVKEVTITIKD